MSLAYESDTIAAIATPEGEGGISVIRVSGDAAIDVASRGFRGSTPVDKMSSHTAHYGRFVDEHGHTIDNVLALVFRKPNSFTGEDTVRHELVQKIIEAYDQLGPRKPESLQNEHS